MIVDQKKVAALPVPVESTGICTSAARADKKKSRPPFANLDGLDFDSAATGMRPGPPVLLRATEADA